MFLLLFIDIIDDDPRHSIWPKRKVPLKEAPPKNEDEQQEKKKKFDTTIVKFNDNTLSNYGDLMSTLESILLHPLEITWLDLSVNEFTTIDEVRTFL